MKVQFWGTSKVTAVETQGYPGGPTYTKQYLLAFSSDCVTFQPILDDFGNNKVFHNIWKHASSGIKTAILKR